MAERDDGVVRFRCAIDALDDGVSSGLHRVVDDDDRERTS